MNEVSSADWSPCPKGLGENNHAILSEWLDYSNEDIRELESSGGYRRSSSQLIDQLR
ncbi:MAG: hypothetical protein CM1200mP9_09060 [Gammaproteobacteria bacterium]|nr:MAG: hypothetical protein CM1200mP9_09060 [Gammaproteobacteria bacterium]